MLGTRLADRYEIVSELGRGGMGVVYRARDPRLNRDVAVKLVPPSQLSADAERALPARGAAGRADGPPAIVPIYDFGRHEDVALLRHGARRRARTCARSCARTRQLGDVLDIGIQVAEALDYSHARGVVHRDIKPENIMVARDDGRGVRVRVMDFGLARATSESRMTRTGTLMGTLGYLSPEQITGQRPRRPRPTSTRSGRCSTSAWSASRRSPASRRPSSTGSSTSSPQAPRARGAAIDEALEGIVLACLRKDPAKRPQRAGEVAEALRRYRAELRDSDRGRNVAGLTQAVHAPRAWPRCRSSGAQKRIGGAATAAERRRWLASASSCWSAASLASARRGCSTSSRALAKARQIRVLHGQSVEQDRGLPYQAFLEMILEYFRVKDSGSAPAPDLSDLAPDLLALFPMLSEVAEIRSAAGSQPSVDRRGAASPESRTQVFELFARTLTRLAAGRPLVLFMEDLHAADISLEALEYIVRRLGPMPILFVGTYRSTEVHGRHPLNRMIEEFQGERRAGLADPGAAVRLGAPRVARNARRRRRRRRPGQKALPGQRRQPVLHEGAGARSRGFGRHCQGRQRRLDPLGRGEPRGRRVAAHDPEGGRASGEQAAGRSTRHPVGRVGHRQELRCPRSGGAGPGEGDRRCD